MNLSKTQRFISFSAYKVCFFKHRKPRYRKVSVWKKFPLLRSSFPHSHSTENEEKAFLGESCKISEHFWGKRGNCRKISHRCDDTRRRKSLKWGAGYRERSRVERRGNYFFFFSFLQLLSLLYSLFFFFPYSFCIKKCSRPWQQCLSDDRDNIFEVFADRQQNSEFRNKRNLKNCGTLNWSYSTRLCHKIWFLNYWKNLRKRKEGWGRGVRKTGERALER